MTLHHVTKSSFYCLFSVHNFSLWTFFIYFFCSQFLPISLKLCQNCVHNCEDHCVFIWFYLAAVLKWFISYTSITFISFTGKYEQIIDQLPTSVASYLSWLEHRTGIKPFEVLNFFSDFLRNCINYVPLRGHSSFDFISAVLLWFISYTSITVRIVLDCFWRRRSASSCVCSFPILRNSPLKSNVWKWVLFAWAGITNLDIHGYWISVSKSRFRLPLLKSIL